MKIIAFEINSYKSCVKTKFPIHKNLTALIGANGAGKSNIMTALLLLKKIFSNNQDFYRDFSNKCKIHITLIHRKKTFSISIKAKYETDDRNTDKITPNNINWNVKPFFPVIGDDFEFPLNYLLGRTWRYHEDYRFAEYWIKKNYSSRWAGLRPVIGELLLFCKNISNSLSSITYYSASQFSDPSKCPVSFELEDKKIIRRPNHGPHMKFIGDLYYSYLSDNNVFKRYLSLVDKSGLSLIEGLSFAKIKMPSTSFEILSGGKVKEIVKTRVLVVPHFKVDNNILSPNQLSEGTFKTLALIFYILTDKSKILLIEEPEVGIHHGLLNSIIGLIKEESKRKQIIISTHSDFVIDQINPDNVVLVQKVADKGTVAKSLNKHLRVNDYRALKNYLQESGNLGEYWKEGGIDG